jgi:hypothetical protein
MKQFFVNFLLKFSGKNNSKQYKIISLIFGSVFFIAILPGIFITIGIFFKNYIQIKIPAAERRGIEDFSLKSLRMWGNKSPTPPVLTAPRGGVLNPK